MHLNSTAILLAQEKSDFCNDVIATFSRCTVCHGIFSFLCFCRGGQSLLHSIIYTGDATQDVQFRLPRLLCITVQPLWLLCGGVQYHRGHFEVDEGHASFGCQCPALCPPPESLQSNQVPESEVTASPAAETYLSAVMGKQLGSKSEHVNGSVNWDSKRGCVLGNLTISVCVAFHSSISICMNPF